MAVKPRRRNRERDASRRPKRVESRGGAAGAVLGGAAAGALIAALPHLPFRLSIEVLHARDYILEFLYLVVERLTPVAVPPALNAPAGVAVLFVVLGALLGSGAFVIARIAGVVRARFAWGFAFAAGVFLFAALVAMIKTLFFYPFGSILSIRGILFLAAAAAVAAMAAALLGILLRLGGRPAAALILAAVVLAGSLAWRPWDRPEASPVRLIERVVLIGVDGLSWNVLDPLLDAGRLPAIRRLVTGGASGHLRATLPFWSPILWTTIATGLREDGHGIRRFTKRSRETGELLPVSVGDRTAAALWDICGLAGRSVGVVNWYGGWPAEQVTGTFASNRLGFRSLPDRVHPPERLADLEALAADAVEMSTDDAARVALRLLETDRPDLLMVYFPMLDHLLHRSWHRLESAKRDALTRLLHPARLGAAPAGDPAAEELVRVDRFVSEVLERAGAGTVVALVSDHGFGVARGPRQFRTHILLERLGWWHPGPREQETDWTRTVIFDAGPDITPKELPRRFVLNERPEGPFGSGAVETAPARFLTAAEEVLGGLKTESGRRVAPRTKRVRDPETGREELLVWLDLDLPPEDTVEFGDGRMTVAELLQAQRHTGMHRLEGVFIAGGPGIAAGRRISGASVLDVAPTVLRWLGLPAARTMRGRALDGILEPAYRRANPRPAPVPTYGGPRGTKSGGSGKSAADEKILETLRSLGYIR